MKKTIIYPIIALIIILFASDLVFAIKNPSAVYCTALGYEYRVINTNLGEEGICVLPDGKDVDAWKFLRGDESTEFTYCALNGLEQHQAKGIICSAISSPNCLTCIIDGESIEVTTYMNLSFKEAICGDGLCAMLEEDDVNCPADCKKEETVSKNASTIEKISPKSAPKRSNGWLYLSAAILFTAILVVSAILAKRNRK